ncbi:MAG: 2-amino-4-hydroxy-6-hydroxymethyldihydropteridine diphosphokinase [Saccharofermentans sp.]|nr:2-amino-4-hydroxy-6-hydroxymethyldihydropteridine diphosphokinase [Saccharofermentans sp.]
MDHLRMVDMEFYGYTGCLPEEKENGQTFVVTVDMACNRIPGAMTDNLEGTINYAELYERIKNYVTTSKGNLIENLAYNIGGIVLDYSDIPDSVKVTVSKPQAPVVGMFKTMETTIELNRVQESGFKHSVVLALGSNMGDKEQYLKEASKRLMMSGHVQIIKAGGLYETEPVGYDDQPYFYNTVLDVKTDLEPEELLNLTQKIELDLHRVRTIKNGPRTIDIDILLYDDITMDSDRLIIPHPRMYERAFVLCPFKDIREYDGPVPEDKSVKFIGQFEF